jgi:hypothetical protein
MPGMLPDPLLIGSILDLVGYLVTLTLIMVAWLQR